MGMVHVETIEVGAGGAASIEFTGIPQDGVDLVLLLSARGNLTADPHDYVRLRFNGSVTGYSSKRLYGFGSGYSSDSTSNVDSLYYWFMDAAAATANTFGNARVYVTNYAAAQNKSISIDAVTENNATAARQDLTAGLWANTAAITSLRLLPFFGSSFVQYSTASLYMITAD